MKYLLTILTAFTLTGCASVMNGLAPTDCYDLKSGSVSLNGAVIRPAETLSVCPPSVTKVPPKA